MKKYVSAILLLICCSSPLLAITGYEIAKNKMLRLLRESNINETINVATHLTKEPGKRLRELGNEYLTIINSVQQAVQALPTKPPEMRLSAEAAPPQIVIPRFVDPLGTQIVHVRTRSTAAIAPFDTLLQKINLILPENKVEMITKEIKKSYDYYGAEQPQGLLILELPGIALRALATAENPEMVRGMLENWIKMTPAERRKFYVVKFPKTPGEELAKVLKARYVAEIAEK